jgi:hypothetical protein
VTVYLVLHPMCPWTGERVRASVLRFIISCAVKYPSGPQENDTSGDLNCIVSSLVAQSLVSDVAVPAMQARLGMEECL